MARPLRSGVRLALLPLLVASVTAPLAAPPVRAEEPAPSPPPAAAPQEKPPPASPAKGGEAPPPLSPEDLDTLLVRAERNLVLHGLSLDRPYLQRAIRDYRAAVAGLPGTADPDRRFTALFGLAFCLARSDPPSDPAKREAQIKEAFDTLARAASVESQPPGLYAANPGLWIVDGMIQEQVGNFPETAKQITRGFAELEKFRGLQPWQVYQFRLFGLLARGRAFLQPGMASEHLALNDFKEARTLADRALEDPASPRENRLRPVVLTHLAAAYQSHDYYEEAEAVLAELLRIDPGESIHCYNMALVKAMQLKYPEALSWYRKAADLAKADPRPHIKIGFILLRYPEPGKEPDTREADREGEIYLRLIGGTPDAEYHALKGEAAFLRREMKDAEAWFRRALGIEPACRTALQRLMNILGEKEDPAEEVRKEIEDLRKRLQDAIQKSRGGGPGMETKKTDLTFC